MLLTFICSAQMFEALQQKQLIYKSFLFEIIYINQNFYIMKCYLMTELIILLIFFFHLFQIKKSILRRFFVVALDKIFIN